MHFPASVALGAEDGDEVALQRESPMPMASKVGMVRSTVFRGRDMFRPMMFSSMSDTVVRAV